MLLLASGDVRVLSRWADALSLSGRGPLAQVDNAQRLRLFLKQRRPDLVLLHLSLPGLSEYGGVRALKHSFPETRLLVMTDVPRDEEGVEVLHSKAEGYANTYMMAARLRSAVDVIISGQAWVGRRLLDHLLGRSALQTDRVPSPSPLALLSTREKQVALLVAEGASNQQIADRLLVAERTIKSHLTTIFKKTGIKDRTQLAVRLSRQNDSTTIDKMA